jgi:hypothetical protein
MRKQREYDGLGLLFNPYESSSEYILKVAEKCSKNGYFSGVFQVDWDISPEKYMFLSTNCHKGSNKILPKTQLYELIFFCIFAVGIAVT